MGLTISGSGASAEKSWPVILSSRNTGLGMSDFASAQAWPTANLALFLPFEVSEQAATLSKRIVASITNSSGNVDVGIYDEAGNRLVSSGTTAASGTVLAPQIFNVADVNLAPGRYYMAIACDSTTPQMYRSGAIGNQMFGVKQMAAAFPLPATATLVDSGTAYFPLMGVLMEA